MRQLKFNSKMRGEAGTPVVLDRELLTRLKCRCHGGDLIANKTSVAVNRTRLRV